MPPQRFWNHRSLKRYLADLAAGKSPRAGREELTAAQQMTEFIMLGLRTAEGVDVAEFRKRFGVDFNERFGAGRRRPCGPAPSDPGGRPLRGDPARHALPEHRHRRTHLKGNDTAIFL
jgi:hypothetical protein